MLVRMSEWRRRNGLEGSLAAMCLRAPPVPKVLVSSE